MSESTLKVGVIVFEGAMPLDFIGTTSYLQLIPPLVKKPIKFTTISANREHDDKGAPVYGSLGTNPVGDINDPSRPKGFPLYATTNYSSAPTKFDILLIPGGTGRRKLAEDPEHYEKFLKYLREAVEASSYVLTVCTGSAILADTGYLDGKQVTTNKLAFDQVASTHKQVQWVRRARWTEPEEGDEHGRKKLWTASGVSAGMDMAYAFMKYMYGSEIAKTMAKYIEHIPNEDKNNDPFA